MEVHSQMYKVTCILTTHTVPCVFETPLVPVTSVAFRLVLATPLFESVKKKWCLYILGLLKLNLTCSFSHSLEWQGALT